MNSYLQQQNKILRAELSAQTVHFDHISDELDFVKTLMYGTVFFDRVELNQKYLRFIEERDAAMMSL